MGEYFGELPFNIQEHIKDITKTSGLEYNDDSLERMAQAWIEKKNAFEEKISSLSMEELDNFEIEDERGVLVMTYSGSILTAGPLNENKRAIEYVSIGIRADVPKAASGEGNLAEDIEKDKEINFKSGPIKSTSSVFKIAVCKEDISVEEQRETLENATLALEEEFININKTSLLE